MEITHCELLIRSYSTPTRFQKNKTQVDINDINEQYLAEFLTALQTAINKMSADGERISYVPSKSMELSKIHG